MKHTEDRPAFAADQDFKDCILYPTADELSFIKLDNDSFREAYDKYLDERQNRLQHEFLRLIKQY